MHGDFLKTSHRRLRQKTSHLITGDGCIKRLHNRMYSPPLCNCSMQHSALCHPKATAISIN